MWKKTSSRLVAHNLLVFCPQLPPLVESVKNLAAILTSAAATGTALITSTNSVTSY